MKSILWESIDKMTEADSTDPSQVHPWMSPHGYPEVCGDSSSSAAFARASEWLSYCVDNDQACAQHSSNFVPRRLVNVNLENEAHDPFLVEPTEPMKYACLSYCWGPDAHDVLRTTKDNIEDHRSRIPIKSMPASVRDGVKICRGLNIPYLWVDSLCILQGHRDEWLHDSSQMDLTYLNSHLTIAALEPASCKSGFLGVQLYSVQGKRPSFAEHNAKDNVDEPHHSLNKRGWCLQEEILPIRRLCFDGSEMRWECLCRRLCECGHQLWPNDNDKSVNSEFEISELGALIKIPTLTRLPPRIASIRHDSSYTASRRLKWLRSINQGIDYSSAMSRTHELWREVVSNYSKRTLSYRADRLAALAGVTKVTLNALGREDDSPDEFLAGLWKKEIHFDLAWYIEHPKPGSSSLGNQTGVRGVYCAPSWSWASSDVPVKYVFSEALWDWKYTPEVIDKFELIAAECVTELAEDSTGPVLEGRIRLRGSLTAVELGMLETEQGFEEPNRPWLRWKGNVLVRAENLQVTHVIMDNPIDANIKLDDKSRSCWLRRGCKTGCCLWDKNKETQFYCFRLFSWHAPRGENMGRETWFLLLKKSSEGFFQRIGVGSQIIGRGREWQMDESSRYVGWLFENAREETIDII